MAPIPLFTNIDTSSATEDTPIVSPSFDCLGPSDPVTVSSEDLGYTDAIEIRKYSTNKSDYVPFRQNGTVELTHNNTVRIIAAKGTYALHITKPCKSQISADVDS